MKSKTAFRQELEETLHSHLTLSPPIFAKLMESPDSGHDLLKKVTLHGYQLTKHFFSYVEHLFLYCPGPEFKRALLINVYEEQTGHLSKTDNHVVLMQNFIRALGISERNFPHGPAAGRSAARGQPHVPAVLADV